MTDGLLETAPEKRRAKTNNEMQNAMNDFDAVVACCVALRRTKDEDVTQVPNKQSTRRRHARHNDTKTLQRHA